MEEAIHSGPTVQRRNAGHLGPRWPRRAAAGAIRPRRVPAGPPAEPSRSRQLRLATVVSQAPGDLDGVLPLLGHGAPAGADLLHDILGLGQGAQQPIGEI
jgi:hypothetical protein